MAENNARKRSPWTASVAAQVRAERAARHLTQRDVIAIAGIPKSTYLRLESGERVADAEQLWALCGAYNLRVSTFFARVEERQEKDGDPAEAELMAGLSPKARAVAEAEKRKGRR